MNGRRPSAGPVGERPRSASAWSPRRPRSAAPGGCCCCSKPKPALRVAAFLLPRREQPAALLAAIAPWLDEARRSGKAKLRHGPEGVEARRQRSCIVAPIGSGRERLGFLYADVDGRHGRFAAADRDRLVDLARRCAAELASERRAGALALQLEERGSQLAQRNAELAVINSIQQGMAAELDFQAIVDVVGDKLLEVFASRDLHLRGGTRMRTR